MTSVTPIPADSNLHARTRWPGFLSIVLTGLAAIAIFVGHCIARPDSTPCPITDIWHGAMIAVFGLAGAIVGLGLALIAAVWGRSNRWLGVAGLCLGGGFAVLFYYLWVR